MGVEEQPVPFEGSDGILEPIRPEHVTPEDFALPPEYQELMGERPGPAAEDPPQAGEPVLEKEEYDWPFDEVAPGVGPHREAVPPIREEKGWEQSIADAEETVSPDWPAPPIASPPSAGAPPPAPPPPPVGPEPGPPRDEGLISFFFEDEGEKKKPGKGEPETFWE